MEWQWLTQSGQCGHHAALRHALDGVEGHHAWHGCHEEAVQPREHAHINHIEGVLQLLR